MKMPSSLSLLAGLYQGPTLRSYRERDLVPREIQKEKIKAAEEKRRRRMERNRKHRGQVD